jgi:hypothetical protein
MGINKEWHLKNKMPKNAKFEERVKWHLAHQKNCNCRPIPDKLLSEMKSRSTNPKDSNFLPIEEN